MLNVCPIAASLSQRHESVDDVDDVGEAAALRAVAEDGQVLTVHRLLDKSRQDHPVGPRSGAARRC